jgi:hypothetical protein
MRRDADLDMGVLRVDLDQGPRQDLVRKRTKSHAGEQWCVILLDIRARLA